VLDAILVEAAVEAGAELREAYPVRDLVREDGRVVGIPGERARVVVGADGLHSIVAREVGAPFTRRGRALTCAYHAYFADVPVDGMEFFLREGRAVMAVPTNDGLTLVGAGWPLGEFGVLRRDPEGNLLRTVDLFPELGERVRAGRRVGKIVGTAALPNHFRRPYGPGWALVGDAGYHRDPLVGQGISDAFRDAELLAEALHDGLSGRRPLDDALAGYESARDAAALPLYELACRLATLAAPSSSLLKDFARLGAAA
jgi:flavin-dependent dehydrogenase